MADQDRDLNAPTGAESPLPDFDALWNYGDPVATEQAFLALLKQARDRGDRGYEAELLTQIARTRGLQQRFDDAHATLDEADALIDAGMPRVQVRSRLERGRAVNSGGAPVDSVPIFEEALSLAEAAGLEGLAVDAAHMLGIVCPGEESIRWNERALAMAEASEEPLARRWRGALCNNLGWTYHELDRHAEALAMFERHLALRDAQGNTFQAGIARWSIAKMQRFLGELESALSAQRDLLDDPERQDNAAEGYTREELGECLLALDRAEEAAPHFLRAWELLKDDPWLKRDESERLGRLRRLGEASEAESGGTKV